MNIHSVPNAAPADIVEWSRTCGIRVDGHSFNSDRIPQLIEPMRAMVDPAIRNGTLIKPVQTGGSTVGEVLMAYWLSFWCGLLQFNWQDDLRAIERWQSRIVNVLRSVPDLKWSGEKYDVKICEARFLNSRLIVQGVLSSGALDSETVPLQINEEIHLWPPGTLGKARRRQTLVWNSKAFDISNAGIVGDQLEAAYEDGSMEVWEVLCPGCGKYHEMRFRWEDRKPELGGLRFDTGAGRMASGKYSMSKVVPTIRYQMPCGFLVHDTPTERRALIGRYRKTNDGALEYKRSWTYEAVSVSEIKWPEVVGEWLTSVKALKAGDSEQLKKFVQERECKFYSFESVPYAGTIIYNTAIKLNRKGMPDAIYRAAKFDWQAGYKAKGELEHYWGVILDVDINANSQLVWEGKCNSDSELLAECDAHEVPRVNTWIDCTGVQKKRILQFCYQNGMNAVSLDSSRQQNFLHEDKVRRFFSPSKPIHRELNTVPVFEPMRKRDLKTGKMIEIPHPEEPCVVELNKAGLLANYFFIRNMRAAVLAQNPAATEADYIRIETPDDVSEDFKRMLESWDMVPGHRGSARDESVDGFRPRSRFDHQLMNMAYHCFELEWKMHPQLDTTLLGSRLSALGLLPSETQIQE